MNDIVRLNALSVQMGLEMDGEEYSRSSSRALLNHCPDVVHVHPAILPNGQRIKLLKTLLTSACERDCYYCPFRAGRDVRRATFQPEEFARLFMMLASKGIAEGVFLSSGSVGGGIRTQDKLLDTAAILRHRLHFNGYIHLKVMPGSEFDQVEQAMLLADRVSINLEAPNNERLSLLAPSKQFNAELLQPLKWVEQIRRNKPGYHAWRSRWPSSTTQFVAGGSGESDLELLSATGYLYENLGLKRAYFSAFNPIPDTPLENQPATPQIREHRLYQASFLLRDYRFSVEELPFENNGFLPLQVDPKLAWARMNLVENPLEINQAEKNQLLRVPGIGPKRVEAILKIRRQGKIRDCATLRKIGVAAEKAAPFLLFDGTQAPFQPYLL